MQTVALNYYAHTEETCSAAIADIIDELLTLLHSQSLQTCALLSFVIRD